MFLGYRYRSFPKRWLLGLSELQDLVLRRINSKLSIVTIRLVKLVAFESTAYRVCKCLVIGMT